jgi:hypothetical protein
MFQVMDEQLSCVASPGVSLKFRSGCSGTRSESGTGGAESSERQVMFFKDESFRKHALQSTGASFDVEETIAFAAMKMVVVGVGHFARLVSIRLRRQGHCRDLSLFFHFSDDSIDRSPADRIDFSCRYFQDFIDGKWTACVIDGHSNGIELNCISAFSHEVQGPYRHKHVTCVLSCIAFSKVDSDVILQEVVRGFTMSPPTSATLRVSCAFLCTALIAAGATRSFAVAGESAPSSTPRQDSGEVDGGDAEVSTEESADVPGSETTMHQHAHAASGGGFVQLSEPFEADLFSGWLESWQHTDFSRNGTPYVHAFGFEPAFLCREFITNVEFANGADGKEYAVEGEIDYALTRRIGLVVEGGYSWLDPNDDSSENGFGDVAIAPRFMMLEYDEFLLTLNTEFVIPTGDDERGLGAGETLFAPSISTWLDLGNNFSLQNNVGIEHGFTSNTDALFWGGALIYSMYTHGSPRITNGSGGVRGHFPKGMLSLIAEIGGELSLDGDDKGAGAAEWLFGVSYAISSKVQIRGALSFPAWNPRNFDNGATIGFLYHF